MPIDLNDPASWDSDLAQLKQTGQLNPAAGTRINDPDLSWDPVLSGQATATAPVGAPTPGMVEVPDDFGDPDLKRLQETGQAPPPGTPHPTLEPMTGWDVGYKALHDRLIIGGGAISKAVAGFQLAGNTVDMDGAHESVATQELTQAQMDTDEYRRTHGYLWLFRMKDMPGWDRTDETTGLYAADIPGWIIEQIPNAGVTFAGTAAGALLGSLTGKPQGIEAGAIGGTWIASGAMIFGNHVYDVMDMGVDHDTAVVSGLIVGAIGGALDAFGLHGLAQTAPKAAQAIFRSVAFKETYKRLLGIMARGALTEVATEDLQQATDSVAKYIETRMSASATHQYGLKEMYRDLAQSTLQAAVVGGAFTGAGSLTGTVSGSIAKNIQARYEEKRAMFDHQLVQEQMASIAAEETARAEYQAQVAATVQNQQAAARKQLKGYVNVSQAVDLQTAQNNVASAREVVKNAEGTDKHVANLALDQAEAELKQAQFQLQINSIEDALTDPDVAGTLETKGADLENKVGLLREMIADSDLLPSEKAALGSQIRKYQGELRQVRDLQALDSDGAIKAEIGKKKATVEKQASEARLQVAQSALKRRMAERERTINKLRAEIREAKQIAKDFETEADTAAKRDRLQNLRDQQELDDMLLQMFADKTVTVEDVSDLAAQVPTKRLIGLVKVATRQIDKAAVSGKKAQAKLMAAAKRLTGSVIDLSRLPAADKNKLKLQYQNLDLEGMQEALPELQAKIQKLFEKRQLEAARADLKSQLELKIDKRAASKFPGSEELMLTIKQLAKDEHAADDLVDSLQNKDTLTELEEAKLELASLFPKPLEELNAAELEKITDTLVELRETGKAEALRRIQDRQARQQRKLSMLIERMTPTEQGEKRKSAFVLGDATKLFDNYVQSEVSSWRGLMTIVSQFGEMSDMADIFDVKSALSEMNRVRIKWENRWKEVLQENGVTPRQWHQFAVKANRRADKLKYNFNDAGNEIVKTLEHADGKPYTQWELIQIRNYLLDEDPNAISRFKSGNKFSYPNEVMPHRSTLEVVQAYLDETAPHWRGVADAMRQFYGEFHELVDQASFRRFGRHVEQNPTYGGELISSSEPGGRFREQFRRMSTRPGSMLARQGGTKRVEIRSAMQNLANHINQYARESALLEFEQDAQAVFSNQDVRDTIERNIGGHTLQVIDKYMEDIVLGYNRSHALADRVAAWLRECTYSRFLGARPEQFAKQLTGMIHALQFVGPKAVLEGYAYLLANPDEALALMNESGLFQARKLFRDPDFHPQSPGTLRSFNSSLMGAVEAGDHFGVAGSAFPVLLKVLNETGDKEQAIKAFEAAFDTTQSSGSVDELPSLFRGSAFQRLFTIMAQEPTRQVEAISTAWRKFQSKPTAGNYMHFAKIMGVTYSGALLYNLVGWIVTMPFMNADDAEKKLTYILDLAPLGPFSGVAVLGNLLSSMTVRSMKFVFNQNTNAYEPELLATNVVGDVDRLFQKVLTMSKDGGDAADSWDALLMAGNVIGDVTGLPITNVLKKAEPFIPAAE